MIKKTVYILVAVLALSCSKDSATTDKTALTLVTGMKCRQSVDDSDLVLGNPNILVNNKFVIYPNPAVETLQITAPETIRAIRVVPATAEKIDQDVNFGSILTTTMYSEAILNSHATLSLSGQSSNTISLNISTLTKGYYRVFVTIGGVNYWDNFYKYNAQDDTEAQTAAFLSYWN